MSLVNRLRDLFSRPAAPPSTMRNKPGGLARVKLARDDGDGSFALNNCFVTTVRTDEDGFWVLDPKLSFRVLQPVAGRNGAARPGDIATVGSMHDDLLEPIRPVGDGERDESLVWLPPVPTRAPEMV